MIPLPIIAVFAIGYMLMLFAIADYGDRLKAKGSSLLKNPYVYALSLAVYCTAWTFFGSVGRAAVGGFEFLTVYLGPILIAPLWMLLLKKIIRICKTQRITSIADFISARYGKNSFLGALVAFIAFVSVIPYIALQLKAVATSITIINSHDITQIAATAPVVSFLHEPGLITALILTLFVIVFGARNVDATEQHEGLVAAITFESIFKLIAFLSVGIFVTYQLFDGVSDIFAKAQAQGLVAQLLKIQTISKGGYWDWSFLILLSMLAIMFLPRQFQIMVIENADEEHINKAVWLFPLYLLLINLFVIPIALAGLLYFDGDTTFRDAYVLLLPLAEKAYLLTLFVFLGGFAAATGMVIVETVALSTMLNNNIIMPLLINTKWINILGEQSLLKTVLRAKRISIVLIMLFAYLYYHFVSGFYSLVSIGLISFVGVAQFAPAIIGGIYWKEANRWGAISGLIVGFLIWLFTLPIPTLVQAGLLDAQLMTRGFLSYVWIRPYELFGVSSMSEIVQATFWSLLFNTLTFIAVSIFTVPSAIELTQAKLFVDIDSTADKDIEIWKGEAYYHEIKQILQRFLGTEVAGRSLTEFLMSNQLQYTDRSRVSPLVVEFAEKQLAGAIGSASARVVFSTLLKEQPIKVEEVLRILDETRQVLYYTKELEEKSNKLIFASNELQSANERLKELDKMKDEFIATVTHELRTPLTSIRALSDILRENPTLAAEKKQQFLTIIVQESERLSRLINEVLDFQKLQAEQSDWHFENVAVQRIIHNCVTVMQELFNQKNVKIIIETPAENLYVYADIDRLIQVILNLLSNALKFNTKSTDPFIKIKVEDKVQHALFQIEDNGLGIAQHLQQQIFEPFKQIHSSTDKPSGTGLGLAICKKIIHTHGGSIGVSSRENIGTTFFFTIPLAAP